VSVDELLDLDLQADSVEIGSQLARTLGDDLGIGTSEDLRSGKGQYGRIGTCQLHLCGSLE
jgi:hypothetical protein